MKKLACLLVLLIFVAAPANAAVIIKLNDFNFYADQTVALAAGGLSALIEEDSSLAAVLLVNDPGLGDPNVILPAAGASLLFDYDFVLGLVGNFDEFGAFLIDSTGTSLGAPYQFFSSSTIAGTVSFDLSSLVGQTIGLQFQLTSLNGDSLLDSTVTISNVRLDNGVAAIPEPSSVVCWTLLAGIGLISCRRLPNRRTVTASV
jgi:hypothetical protein